MSERDFANAVEQELTLRGRRVLRVCDYTEGCRGVFGLRALTSPLIKSAGADYLVLPNCGIPAFVARNAQTVRDFMLERHEQLPFFLELKDPERPKSRRSAHEDEQDKWLRWVAGGRQ